ncbi:MAG: glycosyltransferase [Bacteroidales bacterium]|nr:glycosyltransferase [Bacteroidales bacterium]
MTEEPVLVTIHSLVYNHEPFLRECLDGFVMQKTNFRFEAIVHDDASTDNSAKIIQEYAEKYPDIIKPIFEKENQYSKHNNIGLILQSATAKTTKYIATCEGDDYWTDPNKLQKQFDFLESHPDHSAVTTDNIDYWENEKRFDEHSKWYYLNRIPKINGLKTATLHDFFYNIEWMYSTCTLMRRNNGVELSLQKYTYRYDTVKTYYLHKQGKISMMQDCTAVYRYHDGGVWSSNTEEKNAWVGGVCHYEIYKIENEKDALNNANECLSYYLRLCYEGGGVVRLIKGFIKVLKLIDFYAFYRFCSFEIKKILNKLIK